MNSYIKTKTTLLLALLLFGLATAFAKEQEDQEEIRLREEVYKYFDTTDRLAFEDAVHQLRSYYKTMGKWHEMYTAWENEIVYDINNDKAIIHEVNRKAFWSAIVLLLLLAAIVAMVYFLIWLTKALGTMLFS